MWLFVLSCTTSKTDSGEDIPCVEQKPSLVVGTGEQEFFELEPEQDVTMVHGPQGGWHMLGSIRLFNTAPIVEIDFTITDIESGIVVSDNHYRVGLLMEDDCTGYYPGMYAYLNVQDLAGSDGGTPPEVLGDHQVRMFMRTNDCTLSQDEEGSCVRENRWAEGSFIVNAALDPVDIPQD
jgi:hypothetical protein